MLEQQSSTRLLSLHRQISFAWFVSSQPLFADPQLLPSLLQDWGFVGAVAFDGGACRLFFTEAFADVATTLAAFN